MSNEQEVKAIAVAPQAPSLVVRLAQRFSVEPAKMLATLKQTAFRVPAKDGAAKEVSNEQMMALLIVADQYGLNPFTKELYAFPDDRNGIVPIVSIDGWDRIINQHPQVEDGPNFSESEMQIDHAGKKVPEWIECTIKRRDRITPTRIRERFKECVRGTGPWTSHPSRMLRHKAMIQCARIALGYSGIYDQDEGERIIEGSAALTPVIPESLRIINERAKEDSAGDIEDSAIKQKEQIVEVVDPAFIAGMEAAEAALQATSTSKGA